jgi:hypothetical protein
LLRSHADIRPACELHTHRLWESHADPDVDGYSHCYGNTNGDSYCGATTSNSDTAATANTCTSPVAEVKDDW